MKKFYIPTSTFNFNNILSSESISPKSFYVNRGFGYSRWLTIEENNIDNVILLYDKPFGFSRPTSDVEDHPMLVEIITDENFPQIVDGIYYSDHTIYLSPWHTKFIFFSEQVKRIVMSLSDSSLETKMMRIYGKRFVVEEHKQLNIPKVSLNVDLNEKEVSRDFRINKMKGLLYGYYIGVLLSISSDLVRKNNILQELQDIFYAVLSSEEQKLTSYQNERLDILLAKFNKSNPAITFLQNQLANPNDIEYVVNQLSKYNVIFPRIVNKVNIISSLTYSKSEQSKALEWLENERNILNRQILHERKYLSVSEEEVIVVNCSLSKVSNKIISDEQDNSLMINWINEILSSEKYNGNISSFKEILSDEITIRAKGQYKEKWENSLAKQILNQIRKYVRGQESSFNWNNGLYSSIAAVLSKGNNWSDLLAFMKSKGMSDYRIAFAFYGELNGFANLTRDFTDNIFNIDNWEYLAEVYKEIYGQLLGVNPSIDEKNLKGSTIFVQEVNRMESQKSSFYLRIMQAWEKHKRKNKQKQLLEGLEVALFENGKNEDMGTFLKILSNYEEYGWGNNKPIWKDMQKELIQTGAKENRISRKDKETTRQLPLFGDEIDKLKTLNSIRNNNPKAYKRIHENWNYTSQKYSYMSSEHIDYFLNLCLKEGRGESKKQELKGIFTDDLSKKIKEELKTLEYAG